MKKSIARGKHSTKSQNNNQKYSWNSVISSAKALHYTTCKPGCKLVLAAKLADKHIILSTLENDYI